MERTLKAITLGALAGSGALCFCLALSGVAWHFAALFYLDDHRSRGPSVSTPATVFGLLSAVSCLVSSLFGTRVGRDWYRNGQ